MMDIESRQTDYSWLELKIMDGDTLISADIQEKDLDGLKSQLLDVIDDIDSQLGSHN